MTVRQNKSDQNSLRQSTRSRSSHLGEAVSKTPDNRLRNALLFTVAMLLGVLSIDPLSHRLSSAFGREQSHEPPSISFQEILFEQSLPQPSNERIAAWEEDVFDFDGFTDVCVDETAGVVGFFSDKTPESTFELCHAKLLDRGWAVVDRGNGVMGSYLKKEGTHTWLVLSCTQVGTTTAVVVRVA